MVTQHVSLLVASIAALIPLPVTPQRVKAEARPVAIVIDVRGQAWADAQGLKKVRVRQLDWYPGGTVLATEAGSSIVVVFQNGLRARASERSALRVTADGPKDVQGVVDALSPVPPLPQVSRVALQGPASRINAVRVRGETFLRMQPDEGATALANAVRVEFEPAREFPSYTIAVERDDATILYETTTPLTSVVVPAGVLQAGTAYHWRVATRDHLGRGARDSGWFVTLTTEQAARREALRSALGSSPSDLLFLAEVDHALGLLREAHAGFELARQHGVSSERIAERLHELEALLPRPR